MATLDEVRKLDIRVGTVLSVAPHPKADKLYLLDVDIGERRQLVAGLREHYTPDELTGKKIIVIANLEPATIRGHVSQGMLLAADRDGVVSVLTVDRDIGAGAAVR